MTEVIEEKRGPGRPRKEEKIVARVVRGFYPEEDKKVHKGTIIDVTPMELIEGLEAGTLERVK